MDSFSLIQQFFTQMTCQHCSHNFEPNSIELIREDKGVYLVAVNCHHCERQVGVAMVGLESKEGDMVKAGSRFKDPELTEEELERLQVFEPIETDDVIEAHDFFQNLGKDWQKHIPQDMLERLQAPEEVATEEPVEEASSSEEEKLPPDS